AGGLVAASAAWPAALGLYVWAGGLFLAGSLLDALDGPLARHAGAESRFGAVLDAFMDRIGEGALLIGLCIHFAAAMQPLWAGMTALTLLASLLTSYLRAWGERFSLAMGGDWLTRPERVLVLGVGLMLGMPEAALVIVLLLAACAVAVRLRRLRRC
ncbi:MAG: CDP-alcohol phosphatidyltransferase family protein, partial [Mariprofundaceae bacterium]|nr:CDP-alcohol phosphatidyltransferase family protein [Mariprofundaceae bacterium]